MNNRYNEEKTTIFTSNFNGKELTDMYGGAIVSRMSSGEVVIINNKSDHRLKNNNVKMFEVK